MQGRRKPMRLPGFDYSLPGAYFITICSHHRRRLFGSVSDGALIPNKVGKIIQNEWQRSASIRQEIQLDIWVLMPNHLHAIIWIQPNPNDVGATGRSPLPQENVSAGPLNRSLGSLIAGFKAASTWEVTKAFGSHNLPLWQRNYYDHIIRNERDLDNHRRYYLENPLRWEFDKDYSST